MTEMTTRALLRCSIEGATERGLCRLVTSDRSGEFHRMRPRDADSACVWVPETRWWPPDPAFAGEPVVCTFALSRREVILESATGRGASLVSPFALFRGFDVRRRWIGSAARTMRDRSIQQCRLKSPLG